jgi:predicted membrane protein
VPPDDRYGERLRENIERDVHDRIQRKMARFEDRMRRRQYRHSGGSGIVLGAIIVLVGLGLLLDNMGIVRFHDVWHYWPVLLIVYGVSRILSCQAVSSLVWGGAIALIGAFLLLDNLDIINFNFEYIWPVIIIAFGLSLLFRAVDRRRYLGGVIDSNEPVSNEPAINVVAILSGSRGVINNPDFRGGEIVAIFGGVRLDLRQAGITVDRAVLDTTAIFGGVELRVPETWSVESKGVGIFGGFDDKTVRPKADPNVKTPQLTITGTAVFGGVSISN